MKIRLACTNFLRKSNFKKGNKRKLPTSTWEPSSSIASRPPTTARRGYELTLHAPRTVKQAASQPALQISAPTAAPSPFNLQWWHCPGDVSVCQAYVLVPGQGLAAVCIRLRRDGEQCATLRWLSPVGGVAGTPLLRWPIRGELFVYVHGFINSSKFIFFDP